MEAAEGKNQTADPLASQKKKKKKKTGKAACTGAWKPHELLMVNSFSLQARRQWRQRRVKTRQPTWQPVSTSWCAHFMNLAVWCWGLAPPPVLWCRNLPQVRSSSSLFTVFCNVVIVCCSWKWLAVSKQPSDWTDGEWPQGPQSQVASVQLL